MRRLTVRIALLALLAGLALGADVVVNNKLPKTNLPVPSNGFGKDVAIISNHLVATGATSDINGFVSDFAAASWEIVESLNGGGGANDQEFGACVALEYPFLIVGAPGGGGESGVLYVWRWDGTAWADGQVLGPDIAGWARMGSSCDATTTVDGSLRIIAGAPDYVQGPKIGAAAMYQTSTGLMWTVDAPLVNPSPETDPDCGRSVAANGEWVAIGCPSTHADSIGEVLLFSATGSDPLELIGTLPYPGGLANDRFGAALGFSGQLLVVGGTGMLSTGGVVVYRPDSTTLGWGSVQTLVWEGAAADQFGASVAVDGVSRVMVVGGKDRTGVKTYRVGRDRTTFVEVDTLILDPVDPGVLAGNSVAVGAGYVLVGDSLNAGDVFYHTICGDGVVAGLEECDDGNWEDHLDECTSECILVPGRRRWWVVWIAIGGVGTVGGAAFAWFSRRPETLAAAAEGSKTARDDSAQVRLAKWIRTDRDEDMGSFVLQPGDAEFIMGSDRRQDDMASMASGMTASSTATGMTSASAAPVRIGKKK